MKQWIPPKANNGTIDVHRMKKEKITAESLKNNGEKK